jgi:dephospho-CoA kinase
MFTVGLTGGIGSGKSTAARFFNQLGVTVVDADIIARQVVEPGQASLEKIVERFGNNILQYDGSLNRTQLREIVFTQAAEKQWLESLLHPLIYELAQQQLHTATGDYVIYMSPLIFESQQKSWCNRIVVVDISEAMQIIRASERDHASTDNIRHIIANQLPRNQRLALADDILDNSGTRDELEQRVNRLHVQLQSLAKKFKQDYEQPTQRK